MPGLCSPEQSLTPAQCTGTAISMSPCAAVQAKVADFGVFVNIGAPNWGLLHRSQFKVRTLSLLGYSVQGETPMKDLCPLQSVCFGSGHSPHSSAAESGEALWRPCPPTMALSTACTIGCRAVQPDAAPQRRAPIALLRSAAPPPPQTPNPKPHNLKPKT